MKSPINSLLIFLTILSALMIVGCQPVPVDGECPHPEPTHPLADLLCPTDPYMCSNVKSSLDALRQNCGANQIVVWQRPAAARVLAYELTNLGQCDILIDISTAGQHLHGTIKPGETMRGSANNVSKITMSCYGDINLPCVLRASIAWL